MTTETFTVKGMTCEHCVRAVSDELRAIAGVRDVTVELATGAVTVDSDAPVPEGLVAAAVDEAGYELVS